MLVVTWWLQLKMRSRSSFDGFLSIVEQPGGAHW